MRTSLRLAFGHVFGAAAHFLGAAAPLLAASLLVTGCDAGRGEASRRPTRTDSVLASPREQAAASQPSTGEEAPAGDPAPAPAPLPAKQTAPQPKLPQLPFQLPTLPANLRLPFPLPPGFPTAPPQIPAAPRTTPAPQTAPAPQPVGSSRVTVFGIPGCGACSSLKSKLAAKNVPYQYVDIDSAKRETVPREVYGKVPKTRVIGKSGQVTWVEGDDADKIERAFKS